MSSSVFLAISAQYLSLSFIAYRDLELGPGSDILPAQNAQLGLYDPVFPACPGPPL
jgi:hypothetical protein